MVDLNKSWDEIVEVNDGTSFIRNQNKKLIQKNFKNKH